jgi:hypothetical protein
MEVLMSMNRIDDASPERQALVDRIGWFGMATLVLTMVHHAYGAFAFGTPWRLHVAVIVVPVAAAIASARYLYRRNPRGRIGALASWTMIGLTVIVPVAFFGGFEGLYNHVMKNAFYFADASPRVLNLLFPTAAYEPPRDVFFEITGVLHVVPAGLAGVSLWRLFRSRPTASISQAAA